MSKETGGAAYPNVGDGERYDGMTLRDYFAGQALIGLLSFPESRANCPAETFAKSAYIQADAMLAERSKT